MDKKIENELNKFPVVIYRQVQWGEMDSANHVNNVTYLRWAETARLEYFRKMNLEDSFSSDLGPILAYQNIKYIFPITYPDTVHIGTSMNRIEEDRIHMQCRFYSEKHQRIIAISNHSMKAYDYRKLKKVAIPESWLALISEIESS